MNSDDVLNSLSQTPRPADISDPDATAHITGSQARKALPQLAVETHGDAIPVVGESLDNCRIVAELGRGAAGWVFLARQEPLADRPLVLKVTRASSRREDLNLARLIHTNIMPLYWAGTLPARGLRVLAMPYLARTTLAGLFSRLAGDPIATWTGQRVCEVLEADQAQMPVQIAARPNHVQHLKESSWVAFIVRTGQVIAEALAYAHDRDLLHLDLKPSNILITPDGEPILLDLDVARQPVPAETTIVPWLGGTWSFMSPEQRAAITALTDGNPTPLTIDRRSDLYSLGLILYSALGGDLEAHDPPNPAALPQRNPHVSQGLADIIARCLAVNPEHRYPDGRVLAEDLRLHLHDLPLQGVRNQLSERWRKWRRRRPLGLPLLVVVAGFVSAAGTAGMSLHQQNDDRRRQAEAALHAGEEYQRSGQHEAAISQFLTGQELAKETYGAVPLQAELSRRLAQARRLRQANELNDVVGTIRFYAMQEYPPRRLQWVLEAAGRRLWAERDLLTDRTAGSLEHAVESRIQTQLQELVLLWSDLYLRVAPPEHAELTRAEIRKVIAEAEEKFGPSLAVSVAREQLGEARTPHLEPQGTWEYCILARHALSRGDVAAATRFCQAALAREPLDFVPNFYLGVCAFRAGKYSEAASAFSFCLGQQPSAECFVSRGQALARLGDTNQALRDFNSALERNPELGVAYQLRGELYRSLGRVKDAEADLQRARRFND